MNSEIVQQALAGSAKLRDNRRSFLQMAGGASVALAGSSLLAACGNDNGSSTPAPVATTTPTPPATAITDFDILNFALNLEYLEAEFYLYATTGAGLPANMRTGSTAGGPQGAVTAGRQVTFTDPVVRQYAREIAADEMAHVAFLRTALGTSAVAEPAIDVGFGLNNAFSNAGTCGWDHQRDAGVRSLCQR